MFKQLADWLDDRSGYRHLMKEALDEPIPGGARWRYVFGSALSVIFMVQVFTGLLLMTSYSPSSSTAWGSVFYISHEMWGGWFIRGVHHFAAQAMVVLLVMHLLQVLVGRRLPPPPRAQLVVRDGAPLLDTRLQPDRLSASLGPERLLGDQGRDQHHGRSARHRALSPKDHRRRSGLRQSDGHSLLRPSRRLLAHVARAVPGRTRRPVPAPRNHHARRLRKAARSPPSGPSSSSWTRSQRPGPGRRDRAGAGRRGRQPGRPRRPRQLRLSRRPEWYFLSLFQMLKLFPGSREIIGTFVIPTALVVVMMLLPLLDRVLPRRLAHFLACGFVFAVVGAAGYLTVQAMLDDGRNELFQKGRKKADAARQRALYLAGLPDVGIPPDGAAYILRRDPLTQGSSVLERAAWAVMSLMERGPAPRPRPT